MSVKRYVKAVPRVGQKKKAWKILLPLVSLFVGLFLLANVAGPIAWYFLFTAPTLQASAQDLSVVMKTTVLTSPREYLFPTPMPTPVVVATELDYTNLSNWFPEQILPILAPAEQHTYKLSIPKVGIEDADVVIGGTNLDQHLIQYPGSALPGDYGAPVVFGHSVLRQFYNPSPKNPRRYNSIFSKIMTLEVGDEIFLRDDSITYTYSVIAKTQVKPEDRYILEQQRNAKLLKLVTCVPEGTYLFRGVVTAQLKDANE